MKYLKSDLEVERLDETGKAFNNNVPAKSSIEEEIEIPEVERRSGPPSPPGANTEFQEPRSPNANVFRPEKTVNQEIKMK